MKVGFIGLGAMGLPMAKNVLKAGHEVYTTFNRNRAPADELRSLGAHVLENPRAIASNSDAVITVLPADAELKEVALGEGGLIEGFSGGEVLIDMTTSTALTLQEVEAALKPKGVKVLDAPVSGGTPAAADGTLTIIAGGDGELLETYRSLLETMGKTIFHVGGVGQGKVVKMINQLMADVHLLTVGEAFALGVRCGADPVVLHEVIKESSGYSRMMDLRLPGFLLDGTFEPGFKLDLMKKDVGLAADSAKELNVPLLFGGLAYQLFTAASGEGRGDEDFAAAAEYLANMAQTDLTKTK